MTIWWKPLVSTTFVSPFCYYFLRFSFVSTNKTIKLLQVKNPVGTQWRNVRCVVWRNGLSLWPPPFVDFATTQYDTHAATASRFDRCIRSGRSRWEYCDTSGLGPSVSDVIFYLVRARDTTRYALTGRINPKRVCHRRRSARPMEK